MSQLIKFLLFPFGIIYWFITRIRNLLFDYKILRSLTFSLPIINVGNLSVGGTGKTPHIELLIRLLKANQKLAVLSRGYGRKVYGFQIANSESTAVSIGDEPFQYYRKFGNQITVAVDADRVNGVSEICLEKPETDIILLDDAYQHRNIKPGFNILLTDIRTPFYNDYILPVGTLRESRKGKNRADVIIVTKCDAQMTALDKDKIKMQIRAEKEQSVFFSHIKYGEIHPLTKFNKLDPNQKSIVLVTGIARAEPLFIHLSKTYNIIKHFNFADHYSFKEKDIAEIHNIITKFAEEKPVVITTEKDAMRLLNKDLKQDIDNVPWYFQEITVELDNQKAFNQLIENYVQENSRDY